MLMAFEPVGMFELELFNLLNNFEGPIILNLLDRLSWIGHFGPSTLNLNLQR